MVQTRPLKQGRYLPPLSLIRKGRASARSRIPAPLVRTITRLPIFADLMFPYPDSPPKSAPPPPASTPNGWGVWMVLLSFLALGVWGTYLAQRPFYSDSQVIWRTTERLAHTQNGESTRVSLPDSWKPNQLPPVGSGLYRLTFDLSAPAALDSQQRPWSLRIDRLCAAHEVLLNQQRIRSTLTQDGWLGEQAPDLIDIPAGTLKAGSNVLDVQVRCVLHGGLAMPELAPKATLQPGYLWHIVLTQYLPLGLNLCSMAFGAFVILLWWQRRQETAAGLFGLLYMVVSIRNCSYYITSDLGIPPGLTSWLHLVAHTLSSTLLGWFSLAIANRRIPWFERTLWGATVLIPAGALLTLWFDSNLEFARAMAPPALHALALPSLWILTQLCRQSQMRALVLLLAGFASALISAVHDFVWIRALGEVDHSYWMPWTVPLTLPGFTIMLMNRVVKAFNDIEQLNATLEQKVQERTQELAAANAAKSHFLAAASHDLRQPVSAIGLITDLLHERLTDPQLRGLTHRLTRAVVSMESLLKGLLDLSRLDSGTVEINRQEVRLQPLLDSIASHETESAQHKGLHLRVRPTQATAWTDPILLEQILRNLVGNAVRHTERGGILVGVRPRGDHLLIQVWDTGSGIPTKDQARIFEEFVQLAPPAAARQRGLGLGLAIVKRATQLLQHPVRVGSRPGRGSCFSVWVPTSRHSGAIQTSAPTARPSAIDRHQPWVGMQVLIVEDDQAIRDALTNILLSWGACVTAGAGLNWLRQQKPQHWDLVISDHRLGDGTGREVIKHLRQSQADLPAVIVTGDTSPEQLHMLAQSGLPVLHKPFRAEKLRAMIEETMARSDDSVRKLL